MRNGRLVPVLMVVALLTVIFTTSPARAQGAVPEVDLVTPFTLAAGEMVRVGSEGLEVLLRSIAEDSGCVTPSDCSVMLFKGIVVLRLEEQRKITDIDASFTPDRPFSMNFASYKVEILDVRQIDKGRLQTTFRVTPKAEDQEEAFKERD